MAPPQTKVAKGIIDSMELLQDTKLTAQNKNPKGIAEGNCSNFSFNHIAHAPMGSGLMYFIPYRCFPTSELVDLVKKGFDSNSRIVKNF